MFGNEIGLANRIVKCSIPQEVAALAVGGQEVAESGEPEPSAAACAKKAASGRMQRPAELVPIPECGVKAARRLRKASEGFGRKFANFADPKPLTLTPGGTPGWPDAGAAIHPRLGHRGRTAAEVKALI